MPRGATITVENNFIQGLVTEYSAMNFPENAVTDADNVVFSELGRVTRRPGFDYEDDATIWNMATAISSYPNTFVEYKWDSVGNDGGTSFVVQQAGTVIRFFEIVDGALSTAKKTFFIDMTLYKTSISDQDFSTYPCQFTSGKGYLFIVHPFAQPIYVRYNNTTDTITTGTITIEVRDFERLDDGLATDARPTSLTSLHKYNLFNQGWYYAAITTQSDSPMEVLHAWDLSRGDFPSNADVWWIYKNALEVAYFGENRADQYISPSQITVGNTPAANGHYIYPAWDINRVSASGISGVPTLSAGQARPSCVAFYAGRIFYAGISADRYSDKLYFSQIIDSDDQFGKCYQINDPTSETIFDLLDSDGGVISLPQISKVISLQVVSDALVVFGTNGVFVIRGTENGPFRATDYSIEFVSSIGAISHLSIINVDNSLIWWNYDALYALGKDQIGVYFQVENVSKTTIQSILDEIPPQNKLHVKAAYNKRKRIVQWVYNDQVGAPPYEYNRILELNAISKAFYTYSLPLSVSPRLSGIISISGTKKEKFTSFVTTTLGELVTSNSGENITTEEVIQTPSTEVFKYPTTGTIYGGSGVGFTYSTEAENYVDWSTRSPTSYSSYFISGYRVRGEILRPFNSTPIAVVLDNVDDSEVILKGIWDYGLRMSIPQHLYRFQDIGDYLIRRVKIRGKGKAFQLHFESEGDKPFSIVGWTSFDTGGQTP